MIVNSLISSVTKYFSTLTVGSMFGHKKVSLIVADDNKRPTNTILEIDATQDVGLTKTKTPINIPAESKRVYMDGAMIKPDVISISGDIDKNKLLSIQKLCDEDIWLYVLHSKSMGGSVSDVAYHSDAKLYTIVSLAIHDTGFKNSVSVNINLSEVITYDYDVSYKYGIKQTNPVSGNGKSNPVKPEKNFKGRFGNREGLGGVLDVLKAGTDYLLR